MAAVPSVAYAPEVPDQESTQHAAVAALQQAQQTAIAALRSALAARERVKAEETAAILSALRLDLGPTEIGLEVGRSREHVRRIARENGIPAK